MKITKNILFVILAFLAIMMLFVGILMLINGSLEAFPTEEQMEKARIAGGLLVVIGIVVKSVSVTLLYKINKRNKG